MTLLVSLFATSRNLLFGVFLPRTIIIILQKISGKCHCTSLSKNSEIFRKNPFKSTCHKVKSLKELCYTDNILHKWLLRFPVRFFSTIFTEACLYHVWQTYFLFIFPFVKSISSRFY